MALTERNGIVLSQKDRGGEGLMQNNKRIMIVDCFGLANQGRDTPMRPFLVWCHGNCAGQNTYYIHFR